MIALEEASVVIMVVDGQVGCNVLDQEIARFLRQQKVPVILAVNKCESEVRAHVTHAPFVFFVFFVGARFAGGDSTPLELRARVSRTKQSGI